MNVGTKSLLFGVHNVILHPMFMALAWNRLYGFPTSFRLWCCFFLHDIGYWGKSDMDGETEGQTHPILGATIVRRLYGDDWGDFCRYHSRFYSHAVGRQPSKLSVCDKLAFCFYPPKLYLFLARLSGELALYREFSKDATEFKDVDQMTDLEWYHCLKRYTLRVVVSTDMNYTNYVEVGKEYHPRGLLDRRIYCASVRGKIKGDFRQQISARQHEHSRRVAREQLETQQESV